MENIISFLNGFNIQTLIGMAAILWYFTREMRKEIQEEIKTIKKEINAIKEENKTQAKRSDRLYEMFIRLLRDNKGRRK